MTAPAATQPGPLRLGPQLVWASGSFATGALFNAMALFGLFFMTSVLGVSPALAGTILLVARIYDGVIDPLIGAVSDRTRHRWGPRRIYLLIGALGLGLSFALFFNLGRIGFGEVSAAFMVTAALLLYSTAYSIFAIPYLAMPPEMAPDYQSRTRLMSYRVGFLLAGVLAGSAGAPMLVKWAGGDQAGYEVMGITLGIAATVLGLVVFWGAARLPQSPVPPRAAEVNVLALLASPFTDMAKVLSNAPFGVLTAVKLCQLAVLSTVLACSPYFFSLVLKVDQNVIGQYYLAFGLAGLASVPLYRAVIGRLGKRTAYLGLIALYGLGLASWYLWQPGEPQGLFYARAIVIGSLSTGTLLCALAMLPDTMEYDRLVSGQSREGTMSGAFTFVENVAGALGPFLIGLMLEANGLVRGAGPQVAQPAAVLEAIKLGVSLVPAAFCVVAMVLLLRYRLTAERLMELRATTGLAATA